MVFIFFEKKLIGDQIFHLIFPTLQHEKKPLFAVRNNNEWNIGMDFRIPSVALSRKELFFFAGVSCMFVLVVFDTHRLIHLEQE